MKYTTIFFDLDDTLIDTAQSNKEALQDIFAKYSLSKYYDNFDSFYNKYKKINNHLWDLYAENKITKEKLKSERFMNTLKGHWEISIEQSLDINEEFLAIVNTKKNVIDGAIEILEYLAPKYKLYILSNGFEEVQDKKIAKAEMESYFAKVILSDHIGVNKPNPEIFKHALEMAQASNKETIMIGDNINTDILGAKNSQIDQVWYNPHKLVDEQSINPTYTIAKLDELKNIL